MDVKLSEYETIAARKAVESRMATLKRQSSTGSQMELAALKSLSKKLGSASQPELFAGDEDPQ